MAINYTKTTWVNDNSPALNASNLNKIEQGIKDACDGVDNYGLKRTVLWADDSQTSTYTGVSEIALTGVNADYDAYEVTYRCYYNDIRVKTIPIEKTGTATSRIMDCMKHGYNENNNVIGYARRCRFYDNDGVLTFQFENCATIKASAATTYDTDPGCCVPVKIVGINYGS